MLTPLLLVLALGAGSLEAEPQQDAAKARPSADMSAVELSDVVERVVRLGYLHAQRLAIQRQLDLMALGESHPERVRLQSELDSLDAAIGREVLRSYLSDAARLQEQRAGLEQEAVKLRTRLGRSHPQIRSLETRLAGLAERQRAEAVRVLTSGIEAQLRAAIAGHPLTTANYLDLARLYSDAARVADAERVLADLLAVLKKAGGPGRR